MMVAEVWIFKKIRDNSFNFIMIYEKTNIIQLNLLELMMVAEVWISPQSAIDNVWQTLFCSNLQRINILKTHLKNITNDTIKKVI